MLQSITLGSLTIVERSGMYSLNDMHRASGGDPRHSPSIFEGLEQTQSVLDEVSRDDVRGVFLLTINDASGAKTTYANRDFAILYAAWVGSQFCVAVTRAFFEQGGTQAEPVAGDPAEVRAPRSVVKTLSRQAWREAQKVMQSYYERRRAELLAANFAAEAESCRCLGR